MIFVLMRSDESEDYNKMGNGLISFRTGRYVNCDQRIILKVKTPSFFSSEEMY